MKNLLVFVLILLSFNIYAEKIFRIESGRSYQGYSNRELKRRIWDLEKAVSQLQQKVFQIVNNTKAADSWVCRVSAIGEEYIATGASIAVAKVNAVEKCKQARNGDGFFCKEPKCEK